MKNITNSLKKSILTLLTALAPAFLIAHADPELPLTSQAAEVVVSQDPAAAFALNVEVKSGPEYELRGAPYTQDFLKQYNSLTEFEKVRFHINRKDFLKSTASLLHSTQLVFGFGSLVKDKIMQMFKKQKTEIPVQQPIVQLAEQAVAQDIAELAVKDRPTKKQFKELVREKSELIVLETLRGIDRQLWENSRLVAYQNEFSVSGSLGLISLAGVGSAGRGGSRSLGFSFGYNKQTKTFIFDLYTESDSFYHAITPTTLIGLLPKIGFGFAANIDAENLSRRGHTTYPPFVPGYTAIYDNMVVFGFSTALISFPSVAGDMFSYVNKSQRKTFLRATFSPMVPGFVRLKFMPRKVAAKSCSAVINNDDVN